jgi:hypothetical protein
MVCAAVNHDGEDQDKIVWIMAGREGQRRVEIRIEQGNKNFQGGGEIVASTGGQGPNCGRRCLVAGKASQGGGAGQPVLN